MGLYPERQYDTRIRQTLRVPTNGIYSLPPYEDEMLTAYSVGSALGRTSFSISTMCANPCSHPRQEKKRERFDEPTTASAETVLYVF